MITPVACLARLALFASSMMFFTASGCGGGTDAQSPLGHTGDLCHVGNIKTSDTPIPCAPGFECPFGNPDVSQYCVASAGQAGNLCYAGNLATHPPVVSCGPGFVCPPGNPDISRFCVAVK